MVKHQEKKYAVHSFDEILKELNQVQAVRLPRSITHHYYAQLESNDVLKLVVSDSKSVIRKLEESNGRFTLVEDIPMTSKQAGIDWLQSHGYCNLQEVIMDCESYEYQNGMISLYKINNILSVITDFPAEQQDNIRNEFHLVDCEVINVPYNKYLQRK